MIIRYSILAAILVIGVASWVIPAKAGKGDLRAPVRTSAPLLQGKTLDLRFAAFAQGIWVQDLNDCPAANIDRTQPGSTVAIYRGLLETAVRICQVYGAERDNSRTQRAALNCLLNDGNEAIELVTVKPRGTQGLMVQIGERAPVHYRFCERIIPVLQTVRTD